MCSIGDPRISYKIVSIDKLAS